MTQYIYGYRLTHSDGSTSKWKFLDETSALLAIDIRTKENVNYRYSGHFEDIDAWASPRDITVECIKFQFDPDKMECLYAWMPN